MLKEFNDCSCQNAENAICGDIHDKNGVCNNLEQITIINPRKNEKKRVCGGCADFWIDSEGWYIEPERQSSVQIDGLPYDVTHGESFDKKPYMSVFNFVGMDGIDSVKRSNPWNAPEGKVLNTLVYVSKEEIQVFTSDEEKFQDVCRYILSAYSSVGWELLDRITVN